LRVKGSVLPTAKLDKTTTLEIFKGTQVKYKNERMRKTVIVRMTLACSMAEPGRPDSAKNLSFILPSDILDYSFILILGLNALIFMCLNGTLEARHRGALEVQRGQQD